MEFQKIKILFIRFIAVVIIFALYLFFIRDVRSSLNKQIGKSVEKKIVASEGLKLDIRSTRLWINQSTSQQEKVYAFKFPFGFFFLLGVAGLVLFGFDVRLIFVLFGVHCIAVLVNLLFLWLGLIFSPLFFTGMDLISRYLIPLISLGFPLYGLIQKQNAMHK